MKPRKKNTGYRCHQGQKKAKTRQNNREKAPTSSHRRAGRGEATTEKRVERRAAKGSVAVDALAGN
ncbi:MAG: hypothetical protein LBJ38_01505 [Oscillospiraceae bacterium]|nr:hypothetical protein [Oscillospiraceae bacterium]